MASAKGEALEASRRAVIEAQRRGAAATDPDDVLKAADDAARARWRIAEIEKMSLIRHLGA